MTFVFGSSFRMESRLVQRSVTHKVALFGITCTKNVESHFSSDRIHRHSYHLKARYFGTMNLVLNPNQLEILTFIC